jgi:glycosyltransferase involved in cell wall biosynthesis
VKILLVSDYSVPLGGAEVYTLALRKTLRQAGHDARIFASSVGEKELRNADFECWGTQQKVTNRFLQTFNPFAAIKLNKILKTFQPDVVHLNIFLSQLSPSILMILKDVPVVYTAHWYRAICPKGTKLLPDNRYCTYMAGTACLYNKCLPAYLWWIDMLQLRFIRRYFKNIDMVLANSQVTNRRLAIDGISADKTIYYFVDPSYLESKASSARPTVCFVGRLVSVKGVHVLIQAMKSIVDRIPQSRLLIAGEGPERASLEKLTRELQLTASVEFLGHVPNEALDSLWKVSHVLAVPSLWEEPFGIVAIEGLAAGIPVVATRGGALEEIVEDQRNGFLVNPGDAQELADKLYNVLRDTQMAERMGKYGRDTVIKKFNRQVHLDEILAVDETLMNSKKKSRISA